MNRDKLLHTEQCDIFSKENLWSNIGIDFEKYYTDLGEIFLKKQLAPKNEDQKNESFQSKIKELTTNFQLQLKRKLSKILFESSIEAQEYLRTKMQNEQLKQKVIQINLCHQRNLEEMEKKITELQALVKIYEKALINKKIKIPQQKNQQAIMYERSAHQDLERKVHKLLRFHVLEMRIEPTFQDSEFLRRGNLSSSRMNSSILGRSRHQPQALKDMQREWNKSVNLSSKSIKSGHRVSIKKDEKSFMKSNSMRPKQMMSRSFIKQNASNACKQGKQNKLFQSAVSEFTIQKY